MHAQRLLFTLLSVVVLSSTSFGDGEKVVYQADFSGARTLPELGWEILSTPSRSAYEARDGVLRVTCKKNWHDDGSMRRQVPIVKRGALEFDANIAMENASYALGVSLTISVYNISTWFHDYCKDWRRYFPEPPSARMSGFNTEPVGHKRLTAIKHGEWAHYKILFDCDNGIVEYYRNDMRDPVYIDYDVPVLGRDEYEGGYLRIGSMGITKGGVVYGIRNLTLREINAPVDQSSQNDTLLLFKGIGAHLYDLESLAATHFEEATIRAYTLETHGAAIAPKNQFKVDKLPSAATIAAASVIVLADMPAQSSDCLPNALLQQIVDAVFDGAHLLILGGMYSLGKGGYARTPLASILPVELKGPWEVKSFRKPESLRRGSQTLQKADVLWYHDISVREGAKVLLTAGGKPMFVRRSLGNGTVSVSLGVACGTISSGANLQPFWENQAWRELLLSSLP